MQTKCGGGDEFGVKRQSNHVGCRSHTVASGLSLTYRRQTVSGVSGWSCGAINFVASGVGGKNSFLATAVWWVANHSGWHHKAAQRRSNPTLNDCSPVEQRPFLAVNSPSCADTVPTRQPPAGSPQSSRLSTDHQTSRLVKPTSALSVRCPAPAPSALRCAGGGESGAAGRPGQRVQSAPPQSAGGCCSCCSCWRHTRPCRG